MKAKNILIGVTAVLLVIILILGVICVKQNRALQRDKINNLNSAFYYMQEIVADEMENGFKNWDAKSARLYILQDATTGVGDNMGDYKSISQFIRKVSQISDPEKNRKLLKEAEDMKVSWCTENGKCSADIIKK